jgi:sulfate transport system permease protein
MAASQRPRRLTAPTNEPAWVRWLLILTGLAFMALFLVLPLAAVFSEALRQGIGTYFASLQSPDAQSAIRLTLLVAAIAVPLNIVFGICASWAIAKFEFKGKAFLITLIDLPFSVSPVISGCPPSAPMAQI